MNNSTPQTRSVKSSATMQQQALGQHLTSYGLRGSINDQLDPILVFDEFHMSRPTFPPHPHAGFSVMTYVFEDSEAAIINRDSYGDHSRIAPGGLHWTQAGRGAQHEENPERPYRDTHGLQFWVNHSSHNRPVEPKAIHAEPNEISQAFPNPGVRVRILAGQAFGTHATFTPVTPITLLEIHLEPNSNIMLEAPRDQIALLTVVRGNGKTGEHQLANHAIATFQADADAIHLSAGNEGLNALFATAIPLLEPTVFAGPFVMTTREQLHEAQSRFQRGEMGSLESSA